MHDSNKGLLLREIATTIRTSNRALRHWIKAGLLESAPFRGAATRYGPEFLARARLIRKLRDEGLPIADIRRRLATATPPATTAAAPPAEVVAAAFPASATWERIPLLPGLELHLRTPAAGVLVRIAAEIRERYGAVGAGEARALERADGG